MVPVATFAAVGPDPIIRVDAYREVDGTRQGRRLWTYYVHPQPTERALYLQHVQGDAPTLSPTAAEPQPSADVHESKPDEAP
jgi:hypothetical protein